MRELQTFTLPETVEGSADDLHLGAALIKAWREDGILQIAKTAAQDAQTARAFEENERFFSAPMDDKARYVSDACYSGYVVSGDEKKGDKKDYPEVFTIFPDISLDDHRVREKWPCHGPVPWPSEGFKDAMTAYMKSCHEIGHKLLQLTAIALGQEMDAFTRFMHEPWNYMRVLRFPAACVEKPRGIGAHTDYGFFVVSSQTDDQEGLYIRPPVAGEVRPRNWMPNESMSGFREDEEPWFIVKPVPSIFTVFPGDMMQLVTDGYLLSTPHKVALHPRPRRAMPVFIEPDFTARLRPFNDPAAKPILYGEHITRTYMRAYSSRGTTKRIVKEGLLDAFLASQAASV